MPQYVQQTVAMLSPDQLVSGFIGVQESLPAGSLILLQVDLIVRPDDIDSIVQELNASLLNTNIPRGNGQIVTADSVLPRIYITTASLPQTTTALNDLISTQQWQVLLPIIVVIGVIAFLPAVSETLSSIVDLMMMFMMIYLISGMMKGMSPTAKAIHEGQTKIIKKTYSTGKSVVSKGKKYISSKASANIIAPGEEAETSWYQGW